MSGPVVLTDDEDHRGFVRLIEVARYGALLRQLIRSSV